MAERIFYQSNHLDNTQTRSFSNENKKKKISFTQRKNNTINSLHEVETFLNDLKRFKHYMHLYKFFND